jgi:hypothetical protein
MRFLTALAALFVLSANSPAIADVPKVLKLSELKPGIEAIGFSVFKGVEPQPFNVLLGEPIDNMGSYFILARISGGPMETPLEKIGAISGMSGSPIFTGCREYDECIKGGTLVGALSYSIGYFLEGGMNVLLTPAEYMLGSRFGGYIAAKKFTGEAKNLMLSSGLQGAGSQLPRCAEFVDSDIKPGSMVNVFIAKGTISAGVSGTVTWRDGDRIYAFGHPFLGSGMVEYPFSQISVADTLQTPVQASKIPGCELPVSGALLVDGAYEVAGIVGQEAELVPLDVHMFVGNQQLNLEEKIVPDSPLTTAILRMLPIGWATQAVGDVGDISIAFQARIVLEDQPEMFWKNVLPAGVFNVPFAEVFNRVDNALQAVHKSGFPHRLESIHIDLAFADGLKVWKKKDAFLSKTKPVPGETIHLQVVLESAGPATELKYISIPIRIPKDFPERVDMEDPAGMPVVSVLVQDGAHFIDPRERLDKTPLTPEALIAKLNKQMNPKANVLYVQQSLPRVKDKKEEDKAAALSAPVSAGRWKSLEAEELTQLPSGESHEVSVKALPVLDHYIDFNASFNINIDDSKEPEKKPPDNKKKRKRFFIF